MSIWLSNKDQKQAKKALSSLWNIASRKWDSVFDELSSSQLSEDTIKGLELEIESLQDQIRILKKDTVNDK